MTEDELLRTSVAAGVELRSVNGRYRVVADGEVLSETGVLGAAEADFAYFVDQRLEGVRARMAKERADGAFGAMRAANAAGRASAGQRGGGKGGRGGA